MGKEEIARYEQFLLFLQCFQKRLLLMRQNEYLWSKGLKDCRFPSLSKAALSSREMKFLIKDISIPTLFKSQRSANICSRVIPFEFRKDDNFFKISHNLRIRC